ncbi:MAG TPA: type II secretion system F family protein [Gammaproteobacteria bacterium]|nr:type II secretion system F family protein [Gammaproteobacteria bacterium]
MLTNEDLATFAKQYAWSLRWDAVYVASTVVIAAVLEWLGIVRSILAPALLFLWPLGSVLRKLALARAFQSVALLMQSGISNAQAIALAAPTCGNRLIERRLTCAIPALSEGTPFTEAVHPRVIIPQVHLPVLQTAERSGTLDTMLATAATDLNREAPRSARMFVSIREVLLIVGFGFSFFL